MAEPEHYVLWATDNNSYWTPDLKNPHWCCQTCGSKLSRAIVNPEFYLKKKSYDISSTYDGFLIISDKFLEVLMQLAPGSFTLFKFRPDKRYNNGYSRVEFDKVLNINLARAKPNFTEVCERCGQHKDVTGAVDYFVTAPIVPDSNFFRTDLEFGSGFEKAPAIIVGTAAARAISRAGLKGLTLSPVIYEP